jgi:hypothetical protein
MILSLKRTLCGDQLQPVSEWLRTAILEDTYYVSYTCKCKHVITWHTLFLGKALWRHKILSTSSGTSSCHIANKNGLTEVGYLYMTLDINEHVAL